MASLTAAEVTVIRAWTEGGTTGKEVTCRLVSFTTQGSPGNGGTTNTIPASAFGMSVIEQCSNFWNSTDSDVVLAVPSIPAAPASGQPETNFLMFFNMNNATDATRSDPVDFISKAVRGVVKGY